MRTHRPVAFGHAFFGARTRGDASIAFSAEEIFLTGVTESQLCHTLAQVHVAGLTCWAPFNAVYGTGKRSGYTAESSLLQVVAFVA